MSGSNLKVSNPYPRPRGATFPWSRGRRAVVGNGERRSLRLLKSRRGLSFRLHIWRKVDGSYYGTSIPQRPLAPVGMRPNVSALAATDAADEARLDVTQPHIVRPFVGDRLDGVRTPIVRAIDQYTANA